MSKAESFITEHKLLSSAATLGSLVTVAAAGLLARRRGRALPKPAEPELVGEAAYRAKLAVFHDPAIDPGVRKLMPAIAAEVFWASTYGSKAILPVRDLWDRVGADRHQMALASSALREAGVLVQSPHLADKQRQGYRPGEPLQWALHGSNAGEFPWLHREVQGFLGPEAEPAAEAAVYPMPVPAAPNREAA